MSERSCGRIPLPKTNKPQFQQGMVSMLMKQFCETGSVADRYTSGCTLTSMDQDHTVTVLAKVAMCLHRST
jgi:hypothetical protein